MFVSENDAGRHSLAFSHERQYHLVCIEGDLGGRAETVLDAWEAVEIVADGSGSCCASECGKQRQKA